MERIPKGIYTLEFRAEVSTVTDLDGNRRGFGQVARG